MIKRRCLVVPIRRPAPANPAVEEFVAVLARMLADAVVRDLREMSRDMV